LAQMYRLAYRKRAPIQEFHAGDLGMKTNGESK
jgi:hypothetical protein